MWYGEVDKKSVSSIFCYKIMTAISKNGFYEAILSENAPLVDSIAKIHGTNSVIEGAKPMLPKVTTEGSLFIEMYSS